MQEHDIAMATLSMRAYALGLLAFMLIKVLAPGFYAQKDTKTPVKIGVIAMVSNMVLNVAFVFPLMHWYNLGHVGLALATSCSAFINAGLLMWGLRARDLLTWQAGWVKFLVTLILALVLMSAVLLLIPPLMQDFAALPWWRRAVQLAGLVVAGALTFGIVAYFGGVRLAQLRSPSP
jgi:putative peptidoglycan lipid II flippase